MIKSALLFVIVYSHSPRDQDVAEIVYNGLRFQVRGHIDWTLSPARYWQFDWDLKDPANLRSYEKARAQQGKTRMPYGSCSRATGDPRKRNRPSLANQVRAAPDQHHIPGLDAHVKFSGAGRAMQES